MPVLHTPRLRIREFGLNDLEAVHSLLNSVAGSATILSFADRERLQSVAGSATTEQRRTWLEWTVLSYAQLADLKQPPYGDRAIVDAATDRLIGSCGFVPYLRPFGRSARYMPEVGLYWAVAPAFQRQGFATEAARALVSYAFDVLYLERLVASTAFDNVASIGVMRKLGMRIERNPRPEPAWFQVLGVLDGAASVPGNILG